MSEKSTKMLFIFRLCKMSENDTSNFSWLTMAALTGSIQASNPNYSLAAVQQSGQLHLWWQWKGEILIWQSSYKLILNRYLEKKWGNDI